MGFLIQWVVYLAAFLGGSAMAYGIVASKNKISRRGSAGAKAESVELAPEEVEPVARVGSDSQASESGSEVELSPPHWPVDPAQWPVNESVSAGSAPSSAESVLETVER